MDAVLKKNIERCKSCPFREPGCRRECFTGMEIDKRQKARNERIKAEKDKEKEYHSFSREKDTRIIRKEEHRR